jgi:hypothetical protein
MKGEERARKSLPFALTAGYRSLVSGNFGAFDTLLTELPKHRQEEEPVCHDAGNRVPQGIAPVLMMSFMSNHGSKFCRP